MKNDLLSKQIEQELKYYSLQKTVVQIALAIFTKLLKYIIIQDRNQNNFQRVIISSKIQLVTRKIFNEMCKSCSNSIDHCTSCFLSQFRILSKYSTCDCQQLSTIVRMFENQNPLCQKCNNKCETCLESNSCICHDSTRFKELNKIINAKKSIMKMKIKNAINAFTLVLIVNVIIVVIITIIFNVCFIHVILLISSFINNSNWTIFLKINVQNAQKGLFKQRTFM